MTLLSRVHVGYFPSTYSFFVQEREMLTLKLEKLSDNYNKQAVSTFFTTKTKLVSFKYNVTKGFIAKYCCFF